MKALTRSLFTRNAPILRFFRELDEALGEELAEKVNPRVELVRRDNGKHALRVTFSFFSADQVIEVDTLGEAADTILYCAALVAPSRS